MQVKRNLPITISFRDEKEIAEVLELSRKLKKTAWGQKDVYLAGLRYVCGMIKKAQDLVK